MNTFTQISKQLGDLFATMTPSARIMAGLMVGVIVVSLGWIVSSQTASNHETLLGGIALSNEELDRIETAFSEAQLRDYIREGKQIRIPSGSKDLYLKAISTADALPKEWGSEIDAALNEGNVFESTDKSNKRYQTAREREFANQLENMVGIEKATVAYDEARAGFGRQSERVCSITVRGPANKPVPAEVMKRIAFMASKTFASLPASNVAVMDLGTANLYQQNSDPLSAEENTMLARQMEWESYYSEKVSQVLRSYGDYELMVNVELDPTLMEESEKLTYDATPVTLQSIESRQDSENAKAAPSGPPGTDTNALGNTPASISANAAAQSSKTKSSEANERRVAGHEAIRRSVANLVPRKVSVNIGIPESYYREVISHRFLLANPDKKIEDLPEPNPTELADIQSKVESSVRSAVEGIAVGVRDGDDRKTYVTVYAYPDLPAPELPEPSLAENAMGWLANSWSTLALISLVLISMGMMFSWVKSQGEALSDRRFAEGFGLEVPADMGDELDIGQGEDGDEMGADREKAKFDLSGEDMKEDLSTLIKDNPEAAVNLLKAWIGDAA
jgi:flagellar M-ring protein FliF